MNATHYLTNNYAEKPKPRSTTQTNPNEPNLNPISTPTTRISYPSTRSILTIFPPNRMSIFAELKTADITCPNPQKQKPGRNSNCKIVPVLIYITKNEKTDAEYHRLTANDSFGEVSEWLKERPWKGRVRFTVPRVRIPPSPFISWSTF